MSVDQIERQDVYTTVTNTIVEAIESGLVGGKFEMPWHQTACGARNPDGRLYTGVNSLLLALSAYRQGFSTNRWGTFRAWAEKGGCVRKGSRGTSVVFFKPITREAPDGGEETRGAIARRYVVFSRAQVDGIPEEAPDAFSALLPDDELLPECKIRAALDHMSVPLRHGQAHAAYVPALDTVLMPDRALFKSAVQYASTLAHEATHATGHKTRLDRDLSKRFGSEAYALEELIAELSSAFCMGVFDVCSTPRPDHAQYIQSWLKALKNDKRAIFTASSAASKATEYLLAAANAQHAQEAA